MGGCGTRQENVSRHAFQVMPTALNFAGEPLFNVIVAEGARGQA